MDLGSVLDGLLRSAAVTLGLMGMVEVGLEPLQVQLDGAGSITVSVRLHDHLTVEVRGLIQRSARVAIDFEFRYFPRSGKKVRMVSRNLIRYHSLSGRYEVRRGGQVEWAGSLETAAELLGSATVTLGAVGAGLAVVKARASLPDVRDGDAPGTLWSGVVPSTSVLIPEESARSLRDTEDDENRGTGMVRRPSLSGQP